MNHPLSRIVVLDLETSGLNPEKCAILQIGAVSLNPEPLDAGPPQFECLVRCEWWHEWEADAAKVHGETRQEASSLHRCSEAVALDLLLDWLDELAPTGRFILAGISPAFDLSFLRRVARQSDQVDRLRGLVAHRTLDLHSLAVAHELARGADPLDLHTDAIYERIGLAPEAKPHRAIEGARREAGAILELLDRLSRQQRTTNPEPTPHP